MAKTESWRNTSAKNPVKVVKRLKSLPSFLTLNLCYTVGVTRTAPRKHSGVRNLEWSAVNWMN